MTHLIKNFNQIINKNIEAIEFALILFRATQKKPQYVYYKTF